MQVVFLGQGLSRYHDHPLGDEIKRAFADPRFKSLTGFIAFASKAAASFLAQLAQDHPHCKVTIYVGVDQKGTSKEALETLLASGITSFIFYTISQQIYHPKVYLFRGDTDACLLVGSSNLTARGLYSNVESSIRIDFDVTQQPGKDILQQVETFFDPLMQDQLNTKALDSNLISILESCGLLPSEAERESFHEPNKSSDKGDKVFDDLESFFPTMATKQMPSGVGSSFDSSITSGKVKTLAKQPGSSLPTTGGPPSTGASSVTLKTRKAGRRFWIEARTLTSASRNQLDLSMTGVFGRIPGSLTLFGLNGANTSSVTAVTIRYKGNDYSGNRILYPQTALGKSNRTWRMQLNGISASGQSLTPYGRTDFMNKTLVFKEIGPNHYQITPVTTSRQLVRLQNISKRWDQNKGGNGRYFGEL